MAVLMGLSPRVRGNHRGGVQHLADLGSIPARAGEPLDEDDDLNDVRVYPRACGGTDGCLVLTIAIPGLSPRVRGNLRRISEMGHNVGSIPARAGEPICVSGMISSPRVYPRACGGTLVDHLDSGLDVGLSPRVRGNRRRT